MKRVYCDSKPCEFAAMFLLAGGGPPREVMTGAIQTISNVLPLTHVIGGMCMSWLGSTDEALWWRCSSLRSPWTWSWPCDR
jgi:hypothetical protein